MKTKTPKVTLAQIVNDIEALNKDGFLFVGTSYKKVAHLSLIVVSNGVLKTFSTPIRKQGSGKREANASKVKRFYASKNWWILTPEKIEEVDLRKHEFDSLPSDKLVKEKFIEVFRSKLKYSYPEYCLFRNLLKYTVNKISEKEIDVPEAAPTEAVEEATAELVPAVVAEPKKEEQAVTKSANKEDLLIDQIVKLDADIYTDFCKPFIERLLEAGDSSLTLIDKIRQLDLVYFHAQEVCNALSDSDKEIKNIQITSEFLSKFIVGLSAICSRKVLKRTLKLQQNFTMKSTPRYQKSRRRTLRKLKQRLKCLISWQISQIQKERCS